MNDITKHLKLIRPYFKTNIKDAIEFKLDFAMSLLANIFYLGLVYLVSFAFTTAVPKLGLTTIELFIYTTTINFVFGMIRASTENITNLITSGQINPLLIRPVNILFQIYFYDFSSKYFISNFINIIILTILLITTKINPFIYLFVVLLATGIGMLFFLFRHIYV